MPQQPSPIYEEACKDNSSSIGSTIPRKKEKEPKGEQIPTEKEHQPISL